MIYPSVGISIFVHLLVITTVKAKNFLGFRTDKKNNLHIKNGAFIKIFTSLIIAIIMESVLFLVISSSVAVVSVGVLSNKSNFNIIKGVYHNIEKLSGNFSCAPNKFCYLGINVPNI